MKKQEYIVPQLSVVVMPKHAALMAGSLTGGQNRYYKNQDDTYYEIEDEDDFG